MMEVKKLAVIVIGLFVLVNGCKKDDQSSTPASITLEFLKAGDTKTISFTTEEAKSFTFILDSASDWRCYEAPASLCQGASQAFFRVSANGGQRYDSIVLRRGSYSEKYDLSIGDQSMDVDTLYGAKIGCVNILRVNDTTGYAKAKIVIYK